MQRQRSSGCSPWRKPGTRTSGSSCTTAYQDLKNKGGASPPGPKNPRAQCPQNRRHCQSPPGSTPQGKVERERGHPSHVLLSQRETEGGLFLRGGGTRERKRPRNLQEVLRAPPALSPNTKRRTYDSKDQRVPMGPGVDKEEA